MSVRAEFRRFCTSSSMKGVGRIVSSGEGPLKLFWILAVIGALTVALSQTVMLIATFLDYPVVTSVHERAFHPKNFVIRLPRLIICSKQPIMHDRPSDTLSIADFYKMIEERFKGNNSDSAVHRTMKTLNGYMQYVGIDAAQNASIQQDEFILDCTVSTLVGSDLHSLPCDRLVEVKQHFFKNFYNCFEVYPIEDYVPWSGAIFFGIELVLHLPISIEMPNSAFTSHGALVHVTENGIYDSAMVPIEGIPIAPGTDVDIAYTPIFRERLAHPFSTCTEYEDSAFKSRYHCFSQHLVRIIADECNCTEPADPVRFLQQQSCLSLADTDENIISKIQCREKAMTQGTKACFDICSLPCTETQKDIRLQSSSWPSSFTQLKGFYEKFVANRSFESRYRKLAEYQNKLKALHDSDIENLEVKSHLSTAMETVRQNFARLSLRFNDHKTTLLKDVRKMPLTELGSHLGGALNLWSGLTVFVLLETVELVYRIIRNAKRGNNESNQQEAAKESLAHSIE